MNDDPAVAPYAPPTWRICPSPSRKRVAARNLRGVISRTEISPNVPIGVRGRPAITRAAQKAASSVNAMNSCWTHRWPGPPYGTRNPGQPRFSLAGARLVPTTPPHAAARRAEPWRWEPARGCGSANRTQNERNAPHGGVSFVAGAGPWPLRLSRRRCATAGASGGAGPPARDGRNQPPVRTKKPHKGASRS